MQATSIHIKSVAGDLTWDIPLQLEDDWGVSLADRDRLLLLQQQCEQMVAGAAGAAAGAQPLDEDMPKNVVELYRSAWAHALATHMHAVCT